MSQQMQKYAEWLVANQNKKGTPEFDTVANAYKQLRGQPQQQQQPAAPQPQGTDGAFMYGVDRAQQMFGKGLEVAGRLTDREGIEQFGTDMVAQQERDIAAGGYQPKYGGSLRENYQQGTFLPALGEKLLENLPSGGLAIAGLAPALLSAPAWLTFATGTTAAVASGVMGAGESALEQEEKLGGDYDAKVAAGTGALIGFLDRFGAGKVIPTDKLAGMTAEEVIQELSQKGFADAAQAYASKVSKAAAGEGLTEIGQEGAIVASTAAQGGQYTPQEVIDRGIDAGVLGSSMGGGTSAVTNLVPTAASTREAGAQKLTEAGDVLNPVMVGNDPQAATELAVRLDRIAQANDLNLRDVGKSSTKGAREAVDKAHIQMTEELKQLARDLKAQLGITDQDELSVVMDKVMAIAAQREARNKAKSTVGVEEMQAVDRLVGNTQEGQRMLSLMRQMNELTTLHNEGYIGGLSQYTDQLSPIPSNVGYSDRSLIETPTRVLGTLYGASVNPLIPAVQGAAVLTGRTVDALTGRRSRVVKYIKDNVEASEGIDTSGSPSVRRARQREAEALKTAASADARRAKEIHKELYAQNGDLPFLTLDTMLKEMGLSPQQAVKLLEEMKASMPTVRADADDMIRSIKEGGRVTNITAIGAAMRTALDQNQTSVTRDKTPIAPQAQAANPTPAESAGYLRGIEDNRSANDALVEAVNGNPNIAPLDKLVLIEALADLRSNLGSNPAERAMDIAGRAEAKLQQPELADTYLMPYINRVVGQQANDADVETNFMAVPEIGEGLSIFPKTKALYNKIDGIDVDQGNYQAGPDDVTGNSYAGARVYIKENGRGALEVDPEQSAAPNKADGKRWVSNLVRPNLYEWTSNPDNMPQSFIVTVEQGPTHHYALQYEADVPTELYRKPLRADGSKQDEPTMRPRGFGELQFGRQIGEIKIKSSGRTAPIYDTIRIVPKDQPILNMQQQPVLSQPDGEQVATEFDPNAKTEMGFLPFLRTRYNKQYDHPRKILASVNRKNADKQLAALDQLLSDHPNTLSSPEAFMDYLSDAMGKANKDGSVPLIPYRALEMVQNPQMVIDQIGGMTDGQRELAADGFLAAEDFRQAYADGTARPDITGKLLLWGILSRGVSPYIQEALFLDVVTDRGNNQGIGKFINDAAEGNFNVDEYLAWVERTVPEASAGRGSTHNLNAFGETLLRKMSIPMEDGVTPMQRLHDLISSDLSGKEVRREFHRINDKVGINNKVLSFMLLVSGRTDVMVLDRIQFRNMFDDGRFSDADFNLYDYTKVGKKQIAGSSVQALGDDTMGLMVYEALERDLAPTIRAAYEALGRGEDFSMGRYHWESWVASSAQEVDHGTITGIINEALGVENPYDNIQTREGRYNRFDSGAIYGYNPQTGQAYIQLPDGLGNLYEFTPEQAGAVLARLRLKKKSDGIVPSDFAVSESLEGPWYDRPEINKENLAELYRQEGGRSVEQRVRQTSENNPDGDGATISNFQAGQLSPATRADFNFTPRGGVGGSRPPTKGEVRDQLGAAEAVLGQGGPITVGKAGTPFENGVQDRRVAQLIGEALGYTFQIYANPSRMFKDTAARVGTSRSAPSNKFIGGFALEPRDPNRKLTDLVDQKQVAGVIAVLDQYTHPKGNKEKSVDLPHAIFNAFHELGHGIERMSSDPIGERTKSFSGFPRITEGGVMADPSITANSLRSYLVQVMYAAADKKVKNPDKKQMQMDQQQAQSIVDELVNLQRKGVLDIRNDAGEVVDQARIRQVYEKLEAYRISDYAIRQHEVTYLHRPSELLADAISAYFIDPAGFKRQAPNAAAFVQKLLNSATSPTSSIVQFYSAPLAAVVATIMAMLAVGEREEEEEQAALSMGRGALSA